MKRSASEPGLSSAAITDKNNDKENNATDKSFLLKTFKYKSCTGQPFNESHN